MLFSRPLLTVRGTQFRKHYLRVGCGAEIEDKINRNKEDTTNKILFYTSVNNDKLYGLDSRTWYLFSLPPI